MQKLSEINFDNVLFKPSIYKTLLLKHEISIKYWDILQSQFLS